MNDTFAKLLNIYENIRPRRGEIIQGTVLEVNEDTVLIDIGAKRDGIVPRRELSNLDDTLFENISIGDQLPVYVTNTSSYDDELLVSIEKGLEKKDWERAKVCLNNEKIMDLEIIDFNKGGLVVKFGRLNGFVPNSMISDFPRGLQKTEKRDAKSKMIGENIKVKAIEVKPRRKRLIFSGKEVKNGDSIKRLQELKVGEIITGTVSNVVDFGAFVSLDGVDGLIHNSRLSWKDFEHPSEILQRGDKVEVMIKDIDIERERISLDRKCLIPGPWIDFVQQYNQGDILEGEVTSIRDYGAFIKLTEGITGLMHVSELLPGVTNDPTQAFNSGDEVLVKIIEIDKEQKRVSLSMRRLPEDDIANWVLEKEVPTTNDEFKIEGVNQPSFPSMTS
jgi:small subunit ribosomal protein S1